MGITISKDEVKLLENFGTVEVSQQDEILLQAGMKPAPEDNDIKEFLQISGPLAALIRGLITNVLDKYDKQKQGEYEMKLNAYNAQVINQESKLQQQIEAVSMQLIEQKEAHTRKVNKLETELQTVKSIVKSSCGITGLMLLNEVGILDEEDKRELQKAR